MGAREVYLRIEQEEKEMDGIDKSKMTVTMSMEEYEYYSGAVRGRNMYIAMLKRANKDGKAIMTKELQTAIEEIYC